MLWNNWAQLVETIHCVERGIEHCTMLLDMPEAKSEMADYEVRAGEGVGAIEAPRGTLFHHYAMDANGAITFANVITPTAQNLASVERDMRTAVETMIAKDPDTESAALKKGLEMVARAYDPCISCSVHVVRVDPERE